MPEQQIAQELESTPAPDSQSAASKTTASQAETPAPGAPASPGVFAPVQKAADEAHGGQSRTASPHVESQTPENRKKEINPSPEDLNASPSSLPDK